MTGWATGTVRAAHSNPPLPVSLHATGLSADDPRNLSRDGSRGCHRAAVVPTLHSSPAADRSADDELRAQAKSRSPACAELDSSLLCIPRSSGAMRRHLFEVKIPIVSAKVRAMPLADLQLIEKLVSQLGERPTLNC